MLQTRKTEFNHSMHSDQEARCFPVLHGISVPLGKMAVASGRVLRFET